MRVEIVLNKPQMPYGFAGITLCYGEAEKTQVNLNVDYRNIYEFTKIKSGVAFDLFTVACIVYGIDILLPRNNVGLDGWSREIEVTFPVDNEDTFTLGEKHLEKTLNFLTGDVWSISFEKRQLSNLYKNGIKQRVYKESYRSSYPIVNLFSGGMDSLIGAINQLASSPDGVCLVSHTDSMFKGAKKDQENIIKVINKKYSHFHHIPTRVDMSKHDIYGQSYAKETTLRSRSFLFLCMAVLVAESTNKTAPVYIPENGTISLNYPLTPSRRSTCSTRTTHPYYFNLLEHFLQTIGLNHSIVNNYQFNTKGEMIEQCRDRDLLLKTYSLSCSCGKRGTRKDIRDEPLVSNCGVCMPCIYRRAALHTIGIKEKVGTDIFNSQKRRLLDIPDMPAFISYIRKDHTKHSIERGLLTNGEFPLDSLDQYSDVVMRTRREIKQWIIDEAPESIKKQFGL